MVLVHADGLAEIELHYAAQLTVRPVPGFENAASESALPAVRRSIDVPSSPPGATTTIVAHVASLVAAPTLLRALWCYAGVQGRS